jgi:hypothetical protein
MPITAPDIKLLESERMADTSDGGGRRTSRVIPDGVAGNIFPKVSRLDSVYGRINLRKVYGAVQTADVDTYAGAHVVITDAPDNAKINTLLFSTANDFDTRLAARDRIESYVTSGPESRMTFFGKQLIGQQTVMVYQRVEEAMPEIGTVYCLSNETNNVATSIQYIRVASLEDEIRTFTVAVSSGVVEFKRRIITIGFGTPLRHEFNGPETPSIYTDVPRPSKVRSTNVVDAARYFGIQPLLLPAAQNDLEIKVASVYSQIVPTTTRETPLSNVSMGGVINIVAASAANITETAASSWANGAVRHTRRPIVPGTLTISGSGVTAVTDNRLGVISNASFIGTVDYENGFITRTGGTANASSYSLTYRPGGIATQTADTIDLPITISNRGTVYNFTANPLPSPGSIYVDYRALGKWYRLRDNGAGELLGDDAAFGVGSLDYASGSITVTLGALPDVGTSILVGFGSPIHYTQRAGASADIGASKVQQTIMLPDLPVAAGSLSLAYISGGVEYTGSANASGVITGDGVSGRLVRSTGEVLLEYTRLPDFNTAVSLSYSQVVPVEPGDQLIMSMTAEASGEFTLSTPVAPGTFVGSIPFEWGAFKDAIVIRDVGGLLVAQAGQKLLGGSTRRNNPSTKDAFIHEDAVVGVIDYITGVCQITGGVGITYTEYSGAYLTQGSPPPEHVQKTATITLSTGSANYGWQASDTASSDSARYYEAGFTDNPICFDLTSTLTERIVPGSLMFFTGTRSYIDRNGTLYYDVSNITGSGFTGGSIDYETGKVYLNNWPGGVTTFGVTSLLTTYGDFTASGLFFRTGGAPLRTGSYYIQVVTDGGVLLTANSNDNGVIAGTKITGTVDQVTGVVRLSFGQKVTAAGNESEPWFDADNIDGDGKIFKPEAVVPSSLRYNAVVIASLPLNADLLGLDPVRLPSDGRVPIYRPADVVVIHNTDAFTLPNPVTTGSTYSVGRTGLSELWLEDQNGVKVGANQYIYSLNNGTVTMGAELSLAGLAQPLIAKHRVEDLGLVTDVQINGQLTLAAPLSRAYPAGETWVSSAIPFGDIAGRVTNVFDLLAFTSWSDTAGTGAAAQFNDIDYPIEVLNNGAVNERWRINFTSTTAFQVIGENLGVIATGTTSADCSPVNALTGNPYFVIRANGWGGGWAAGNQLRFNTVAAAVPIWIARTVLPGATLDGDAFSIQVRGDVDAD